MKNPKAIAADNAGKIQMHLVPLPVLHEVAQGMAEGAAKYGAYNWRAMPIETHEYYNATRRHLDSWFMGEDIDPDSDLHHVTKAITSLIVLRDAMIHGTAIDTRPLSAAFAALAERVPRSARRQGTGQ